MKIFSALASAVVALGIVAPQVSQAQDWSGFYGGLGLSMGSGDYKNIVSGVPEVAHDLDGNVRSLFAGYNAQNGNVVYGGELAVFGGEVDILDFPTPNWVESLIDLKGRAGYATGNTLIYGVLVYSRADTHFGGPVTNNPVRGDGFGFGLGVDYKFANNIIVGAEYLHRKLEIDEGDIGGYPANAVEENLNTLTLRLGYAF